MITEKEVAIINELYHKSKTDKGLSEEEKAEQKTLRRQYIDAVKENLGVYLKDIKENSGASDGAGHMDQAVTLEQKNTSEDMKSE